MTEHQKDNEFQKDISLKNLQKNSELFHDNQNLYILYRRIQNLVSAFFLVTASFSETEILKNSLRELCLRALSQAARLIEISEHTEERLRSVAASLFELNSLCGVGFWAGAISEMNAVLLQKELAKTEETIYELISVYKNKFLISSSIFKDVEDMEIRSQESHKGHYKRHNIKDIIKDKSFPRIIEDEVVSDSRRDRRSSILKLLGEKGNLSIKDFTAVISSYSEKTIQRELIALVAEGLVKRRGERRWSTYSLAP